MVAKVDVVTKVDVVIKIQISAVTQTLHTLSFLSPSPSSTQVHFPAFIGSSVYLRFLNELVQMLNKESQAEAKAPGGAGGVDTGETSSPSAAAVLKLSHIIMGKDLDDPNSLWERPSFLYELNYNNYACGSSK